MGSMVPLGDASRRPARVPVVTAGIIVVNVVVFGLELMRGDAFVTQWAAVPAQIVSPVRWRRVLGVRLIAEIVADHGRNLPIWPSNFRGTDILALRRLIFDGWPDKAYGAPLLYAVEGV